MSDTQDQADLLASTSRLDEFKKLSAFCPKLLILSWQCLLKYNQQPFIDPKLSSTSQYFPRQKHGQHSFIYQISPELKFQNDSKLAPEEKVFDYVVDRPSVCSAIDCGGIHESRFCVYSD